MHGIFQTRRHTGVYTCMAIHFLNKFPSQDSLEGWKCLLFPILFSHPHTHTSSHFFPSCLPSAFDNGQFIICSFVSSPHSHLSHTHTFSSLLPPAGMIITRLLPLLFSFILPSQQIFGREFNINSHGRMYTGRS